MSIAKYSCVLSSCDKTEWIEKICSWNSSFRNSSSCYGYVEIRLGKNVVIHKFLPYHIVTLSCFIELLRSKRYIVFLIIENLDLKEFILNDISIKNYWNGEKLDHIDSPNSSRLNLWRIVEGKAEEYELSIHRFFSNKFPEVDFYMLKTCLAELYYNVFDHAKAGGNAFSYIYYEEVKKIIHIAICDFGRGIAKTIRDVYKDIDNDKDALLWSLKKGISARSNTHNAGFGLDTVVSALSEKSILRIVSNKALLICTKKGPSLETRMYDLPFYLQGSLIYFDLPIAGFEQLEINEEFTF